MNSKKFYTNFYQKDDYSSGIHNLLWPTGAKISAELTPLFFDLNRKLGHACNI